MVRIAFHGKPPDRPPLSLFKRIQRVLFPPKPLILEATHYPSAISENGYRKVSARIKTHTASATTIQRTVVRSTAPRSDLEKAVIGLGLGVLIGCLAYWASSRDEVVYTHRQRTMSFSWEFEKTRYGGKEDQEDPTKEDSELGKWLKPEEDLRAKVATEIARRILVAMKESFPDIYDKLDWNIVVRKNASINAYYRPGGNLTVNTGLIDKLTQAKEEGKIDDLNGSLALIIAHEFAHGMARHGMERLSWLPIQLPFLFLTPDVDVMYGTFNFIFKLPHSRQLEAEADAIGLHLMVLAGFDPKDAPRVFRLINNDGKLFEWTSTHPVGETRAAEVQQQLEKELAAYEESRNRSRNDEHTLPDLVKDWKQRKAQNNNHNG